MRYAPENYSPYKRQLMISVDTSEKLKAYCKRNNMKMNKTADSIIRQALDVLMKQKSLNMFFIEK